MRKYMYIGMGGFAGAILRYLIRSVRMEQYQGQFPVNTLAINLAGCFALALIMTLTLDLLRISANVRLGIATGFLGALTTFSSVCKELFLMIQQGLLMTALTYAALSIVLGLFVVYLGYVLARKILKRAERLSGAMNAGQEETDK